MSTDLTDLLEQAFHAEPPHPAPAEDVARGRRALRRHRTVAGISAVGVVAASALVAALVPLMAPSGPDSAPRFARGDVRHAGDAEIAQQCVDTDNVASWVRGRGMPEERMQAAMGTPELMTRADTGQEVVATVRSEDGRFWGECYLPYGDRATYKHGISLFRTDVGFPSVEVHGVRVYQPQDESDPRLWGTDGSPSPGLAVPCPVVDEREETQAYQDAQAACDRFAIVWADRRPPEVAGVEVHNPDGTVRRADVRDGYLSYAYTAPMTPAVAARFRSGDTGLGDAAVFLDGHGDVLARGGMSPRQAGPDSWPASASEGTPALANYPSLAWWLRQD